VVSNQFSGALGYCKGVESLYQRAYNKSNTTTSAILHAPACYRCCCCCCCCCCCADMCCDRYFIAVSYKSPLGSQIHHIASAFRFHQAAFVLCLCAVMARGMRRSRAAMVVVMLPCICGFMSLQASAFIGQTSVVSDTHTRLLACSVLSRRADSCWLCSYDASAACVLACAALFELFYKLEPSKFDDSLVLR
jgi:hypothetical protein